MKSPYIYGLGGVPSSEGSVIQSVAGGVVGAASTTAAQKGGWLCRCASWVKGLFTGGRKAWRPELSQTVRVVLTSALANGGTATAKTSSGTYITVTEAPGGLSSNLPPGANVIVFWNRYTNEWEVY